MFIYGGERGKRILLKELEKKLPVDTIRTEFDKGKSIEEISKLLGVGNLKLEDWISQYEYISNTRFNRKIGRTKYQDLDAKFNNIFTEYLNGTTYLQLAKKYNVSTTPIRNRIEKKLYEKGPQKAKEYKLEHKNNLFRRKNFPTCETNQNGINNDIKSNKNQCIEGEER